MLYWYSCLLFLVFCYHSCLLFFVHWNYIHSWYIGIIIRLLFLDTGIHFKLEANSKIADQFDLMCNSIWKNFWFTGPKLSNFSMCYVGYKLAWYLTVLLSFFRVFNFYMSSKPFTTGNIRYRNHLQWLWKNLSWEGSWNK